MSVLLNNQRVKNSQRKAISMASHDPDIPLVQPSPLRMAYVMPVVPWCHALCRSYAWDYLDLLAGQHSLPLPQN